MTQHSFNTTKNPEAIQLTLNLSAALPTPPTLTFQQKLQAGTSLPSIVSEGSDRPCQGINWAHYENLLKLFALGFLIRGEMTRQQKKDKSD